MSNIKVGVTSDGRIWFRNVGELFAIEPDFSLERAAIRKRDMGEYDKRLEIIGKKLFQLELISMEKNNSSG